LIPILDNFELGLNAARAGAANSPILAGMDMVAKQLSDFLVSSGVEAVNGEGQPFDPNLHEAVAQEESATVKEGVVIRQLRRGYKLRDRLLRPATVVVSKGAPGAK
jgi:molecular chaperone GrpE